MLFGIRDHIIVLGTSVMDKRNQTNKKNNNQILTTDIKRRKGAKRSKL
jgi:hypothetical protein